MKYYWKLDKEGLLSYRQKIWQHVTSNDIGNTKYTQQLYLDKDIYRQSTGGITWLLLSPYVKMKIKKLSKKK